MCSAPLYLGGGGLGVGTGAWSTGWAGLAGGPPARAILAWGWGGHLLLLLACSSFLIRFANQSFRPATSLYLFQSVLFLLLLPPLQIPHPSFSLASLLLHSSHLLKHGFRSRFRINKYNCCIRESNICICKFKMSSVYLTFVFVHSLLTCCSFRPFSLSAFSFAARLNSAKVSEVETCINLL